MALLIPVHIVVSAVAAIGAYICPRVPTCDATGARRRGRGTAIPSSSASRSSAARGRLGGKYRLRRRVQFFPAPVRQVVFKLGRVVARTLQPAEVEVDAARLRVRKALAQGLVFRVVV